MTRAADHHPLLRSCTNALRYLGLWKIAPKSPPIQFYSHLFYKSFVVLMNCLFIAALAGDLCENSNNLLIVTDNGCLLAGLSLILFKLLCFQIHPEKIQRLIDFVDRNIKALHVEGNPEYLKIWRWYGMVERTTFYSFSMIGMSLIVALMFFTPTESGTLPIRSKYPFDVTKAPLHQVMFVYQGSVLTVAMVAILAMDNIVLVFCTQTFCHFEILKEKFRKCSLAVIRGNKIEDSSSLREEMYRMNYRSGTECFGNTLKHNYLKDFLYCIKRHQEIIDFVKNLDELSSPLMFVQLGASNAIICLTGFQAILDVGESSQFTKFVIYLCAAFSQLFYWCWYGNVLINQSTSVAEALWSCNWELEKITPIKSLITIPLMRVQKPLKLTAGKFYVMSMEAFISVLRVSYSFFTLLNTMNE